MKPLSLLILVLFPLGISNPVVPVLNYFFNYDYIVEVLCENRKDPELNCNGTCYLQKQVAKESAGSPQSNTFSPGQEVKFPVVFFREAENLALFRIACESAALYLESAGILHAVFADPPTPPPEV